MSRPFSNNYSQGHSKDLFRMLAYGRRQMATESNQLD